MPFDRNGMEIVDFQERPIEDSSVTIQLNIGHIGGSALFDNAHGLLAIRDEV